jgi:hypothetical protein
MVTPVSDYPPEAVAEMLEVLEWFEANPGGRWTDMHELVAVYQRWRDIIRGDKLLDGTGTMHSVPRLSSFGRLFMLKHRRTTKAENDQRLDSTGDDLSAYVPVKELWPQRQEFKRASYLTKYLDKIPNEPAPVGIRNYRQGQRRFVHAADWHRHFKEKDRMASEALDDERIQQTLDGIATRQAQEQQRKQGK